MALARVLRDFMTTPGWETLQRLLAFPKVVLHVLDRGGKSHWAQTGEAVRNRARDYLTEPLATLWVTTAAKRPPLQSSMQTRQKRAREEEVQTRAFLSRLESMDAWGRRAATSLPAACWMQRTPQLWLSSGPYTPPNLRGSPHPSHFLCLRT